MSYLFAGYSVIFILLAVYMLILGKRQKKILEEITFLQEMHKK